MAPTSRSNMAARRSRAARPARTSTRTTAASGAPAPTKPPRSTTSRALKFGDLSLPAGTYTLYTIPTGGTWHLIVSKKTGQWGVPYPKGEDLGRAPMTLGKAPKAAEQLTISVDDTPAGRHAPHRLGHHPRFDSLHGRLAAVRGRSTRAGPSQSDSLAFGVLHYSVRPLSLEASQMRRLFPLSLIGTLLFAGVASSTTVIPPSFDALVSGAQHHLRRRGRQPARRSGSARRRAAPSRRR